MFTSDPSSFQSDDGCGAVSYFPIFPILWRRTRRDLKGVDSELQALPLRHFNPRTYGLTPSRAFQVVLAGGLMVGRKLGGLTDQAIGFRDHDFASLGCLEHAPVSDIVSETYHHGIFVIELLPPP